jgi:tetratricopeptide (TPR) repeat protein
MQYRKTRKPVQQIARELNVDALVEGAIVRSPDTVRISVRLVHAPGDRPVWAESYERAAGDIILLQNEVARAVAEQLRGRLTPREARRFAATDRVNPAAYEAYLEGRYFWNKRQESALLKAVERFQQAIATDPAYARAHAGLADAYIVLGSWAHDALPPVEAFPKARTSARKALELDPGSAEARTALAAIRHIYDWDWNAAGIEFRRAIELDPTYLTARQWYGQYLTELGHYDAGIAETAKAHSMDPVSLIAGASLAGRYYWARRYDEALVPIRKMLDLDPGLPGARRLLGQVYEQKGMHDAAVAEFQRAVDLSSNSAGSMAALGHGYAVAGRKREALDVIARLKAMSGQRYVSGYYMALVHAGLGDIDPALAWLERAYRERSTWMVHLGVDPRLDPLRADERFKNLMARVGFRP